MPLIQKCAADLLAKIGNDCDRVREASMATISGRLLDYITKTDNKVGFHTFFVLFFKLVRNQIIKKFWLRFRAICSMVMLEIKPV